MRQRRVKHKVAQPPGGSRQRRVVSRFDVWYVRRSRVLPMKSPAEEGLPKEIGWSSEKGSSAAKASDAEEAAGEAEEE